MTTTLKTLPRSLLFSAIFGLPCYGVADDSNLMLEEVIVTAQKRSENAQDVPIAISVVAGEKLQNQGISDFAELSNHVPNLQIKDTPATYQVRVRGLGSGTGTASIEQSVGLFVDGIYAGRARQYQSPFFDVERIEVLKGAQGALFGKNTNAGAISIVTAKPTREFEASIGVDYEMEYEGVTLESVTSGPLSDTVSGRLAIRSSQTDGYLKNRTSGDNEPERKQFVVRGTLAWEVSPDLEVIAKVEGSTYDTEGTVFQQTVLPSSQRLIDALVAADPGYEVKLDNETATRARRPANYDDTKSGSATVTMTYDLGDHLLTSITGYSSFEFDKFLDTDFTALLNLGSGFSEDFSQFSQELRLSSTKDSGLDYILGVYYQSNDMELGFATDYFFGPFDGVQQRNYNQDTELLSAFGQLTWHLSEVARVAIAGRYSRETKDVTADSVLSGILPPSSETYDVKDSRSETHFDPSIKLMYDIGSDSMVYASITQGSKSGGFASGRTNYDPDEFEFDPEKSLAYEIGAKTSLFDGAARLNMAAFYNEFQDLQTSTYNGDTFIVGNAGEARIQGVEFDVLWLLQENLVASFSAAYLDPEFTDFLGAACLYDNPGCDIKTNNLKGETLTDAPEWTFNASLDYTLALSSNLDLGLRVDANYIDDVHLQQTLNPLDMQEAHAKVNLRAALVDTSGQWQLALLVKNVMDKTTMSHSFSTPTIAGAHTAITDSPRTITLQAKYNF